MAWIYRANINALADNLCDEADRLETDKVRMGLISEFGLHPIEDATDVHNIELCKGTIVILGLFPAKNDKTRRFAGGVSFSLVAGGRTKLNYRDKD